jgi:hypothetical protein
MLAILVCLAALLVTLRAGRRSLGNGIVAVLCFGYTYGIVRANLPSAASHFIFDSALLGLYASQTWSVKRGEKNKQSDIQTWALALMIWPLFMALLPFQNFWVTMVGLRGCIFFLPLILLGCRLKESDLLIVAKGFAVLNLIAFAFGVLEYFLGIEKFYPVNEVTQIIYASNDVAGGEYRIPSIFTNAHAFGGAMVLSIAWLFGAWSLPGQKKQNRTLFMAGITAAFIGVLLSATRTNFIVAAILILIATFTGRLKLQARVAWVVALALIAFLASKNDRLQRFTSLAEEGTITGRFQTSVNLGFWEILNKYPMGNGLGGGGTSMPYFLQNQVHNQIFMENEYARILAEQGLIGCLLWASLAVWHLQHRTAFQRTRWLVGRRLGWFTCSISFFLGLTGTGLLTAIPSTAILLLCLGWVSTAAQRDEKNEKLKFLPAEASRRIIMPSFSA